MYIAITGNPVDGLGIYGPFVDGPTAVAFGDNFFDGHDWWVSPLNSPNDGNDEQDWSGLELPFGEDFDEDDPFGTA